MKKLSLLAVAVVALLWGAGLLLADPEPQNPVPIVSGVTMRQVAFSRTVEITYKLAHASAIITLAIETNGVALPDSAVTLLTGDVCKMVEASEATKHITWSAGIDWPENMTDQAVARVTAWMPDAPPEVIVVDLRKGTLVSPSDPYPVLYYPSIAALPDGVESTIYKN